ncbi:hypothetical protein EBU94_04725, partial [bacterium]|nr:hypothetical protein [bacterium]
MKKFVSLIFVFLVLSCSVVKQRNTLLNSSTPDRENSEVRSNPLIRVPHRPQPVLEENQIVSPVPSPPPPPSPNITPTTPNEVNKQRIPNNIRNIKSNLGKTPISNIGQVLYQFPDTMVLYKIYNITVRISKDTTLSEVVLTDLVTNQEIKRTKIKVGSYMTVELKNDIETNPSFNITKINSSQQELDTNLYTTWNFRVEPIKSGESQLNLVISIINGDNKKEIVYSDKVLIKSNISKEILNWWETEWKWAFSTI